MKVFTANMDWLLLGKTKLVNQLNNINYNNNIQSACRLINHNKYTFISLDNYCAIH